MTKTWKFIQDKLKLDINIILLVVIDNDGSSRGLPGFKMAIAADGSMIGSIGGGQTEYRLAEEAKKELAKENLQISLKKEVSQSDVKQDKSGTACSVERWVAFYPINEPAKSTIDLILKSLDQGVSGMLHFDQQGFTFNQGEGHHHQHQNPVTSLHEWFYPESIGTKNQLYIFGAGHVGLALSDIASKLGFVVHIFDNRYEINTMTMNTSAQHKQVIDYKKALEHVPDGDHIYVVIMTFGHKSDENLLRQLLGKQIKYLGMMGSGKKVKSMFSKFESEGVNKDLLDNIHAPIGINISSQTPDEIAISVVAEMIAVKNS